MYFIILLLSSYHRVFQGVATLKASILIIFIILSNLPLFCSSSTNPACSLLFLIVTLLQLLYFFLKMMRKTRINLKTIKNAWFNCRHPWIIQFKFPQLKSLPKANHMASARRKLRFYFYIFIRIASMPKNSETKCRKKIRSFLISQ